MDADKKRLLLKYEQLIRTCNREIINPEISILSIDALKPVAALVARSRATYLKALYELALIHEQNKTLPSEEEMAALEKMRKRYLDLAEGSKSIEIAIERDYLDIHE